MIDRQEELRLILEKHIGGVYRRALEYTGDAGSARDVTRRVMALLRRTHETGLSITEDTVKRLTEDCCEESAYYEEQRAIFKDGVIANAPDFDTALSALSDEELQEAMRRTEEEAAKKRAELEERRRRIEEETARRRAELEALLSPELRRPGVSLQPAAPVALMRVEEYELEDEEDEDEDGEEELLPRRKASVFPIIVLSLLAAVLILLILCLLMMLMVRGALPGGDNQIVQGITAWFNASLFPLF